MKSLTLQIASLPDKNNVVVEVWFGDNQVAEVSNESGDKVQVEIFPSKNGDTWLFDFDAFKKILEDAKSNL